MAYTLITAAPGCPQEEERRFRLREYCGGGVEQKWQMSQVAVRCNDGGRLVRVVACKQRAGAASVVQERRAAKHS